MSDEIIRINESERMFIALPVPEGAVSKLEKAVGEFGMYLESNVPIERWHMTMFFMGEVQNPKQFYKRLPDVIPLPFLPTLHITYVGRGEKRDQLWAIAEKSQSLKDLRMEIIRKLRKLRFPMTDAQRKNKDPFVPHVRLAKFNDVAMRMGLADSAINSSFAIKSANVYISRLGPDGPKYYCVKSMSLTS
jgi:2'-5' RNA ligase